MLLLFFFFQVENVYRREKKEDYQSDREASVTLGQETTSSPPGQYNGSYKTISVGDASTGTDCIK